MATEEPRGWEGLSGGSVLITPSSGARALALGREAMSGLVLSPWPAPDPAPTLCTAQKPSGASASPEIEDMI